MDEQITTKHPNGKGGVNLTKRKYELVRDAILDALSVNSSLTFKQLVEAVAQRLYGQLNASIPWYVSAVKFDLEARRIIEEIPTKRSSFLRLVDQKRPA